MTPTVVVIGSSRFPPEKIPEILPRLQELAEATRERDRCIAYDVALDPFDPGLVRFSELWPDMESLDRHLSAPHIEPWRAIARRSGLLDRSFTAYDVTGSRSV